MFELQRFIEDCERIQKEYDTPHAIREVVQRAIDDKPALLKALGEPEWAGLQRLYVSDHLTVLNLAWGPGLHLPPHNHNMWAVIGIYGGCEDNIFYRRDDKGPHIHEESRTRLEEGSTIPLGPQAIHSVTNPMDKLTGAIHVYGGDFFADGRSEWDEEDFLEHPYDIDATLRRFEESNDRLRELRGEGA
ncbi:MAG: hypothetical protein R3245_02640 [Kiloniellales bacterium]|nr:hypothetical protein [Kiloniellales bacterium]